MGSSNAGAIVSFHDFSSTAFPLIPHTPLESL